MSPFEQQLMERVEEYALRIITVYNALPDYPAPGHQVAQMLGKQLLRSGTSVEQTSPKQREPTALLIRR